MALRIRHTAVLGLVLVAVVTACGGNGNSEPVPEAGKIALEDRLAQLEMEEEHRLYEGYGGYLAIGLEKSKIRASIELFDLDKAIRLDPKDSEAYSSRGKAHLNAEMYGKAIQDLTEAIRLSDQENTKLRSLHWYRGQAYYGLYLYEDAIQDFTEEIKSNPECEGMYSVTCTYWYRGTAYYRLGLYKEALEDFTAQIEFDEHPGTHFIRRGNVRKVLGQDRLAAQDFQRACDLMGHEPGSQLIPGHGYQHKNDVNSAFRNSLRFPYDPATHFRYTVEYSYYCD